MASSASPQTGIYKAQHTGRGTTMVVDAAGSIDITSGKIQLPGSLGRGYIPLGPYLFVARELSSGEAFASGTTASGMFFGGLLLNETTPKMALNSTDGQAFYLQWIGGNNDGIKLPPIAMPPDLSTAGGMTIDLYGETVGTATAADAIQAIQIKAWAGIGATADIGTTHANFTTSPTYKSITISSANLTTTVLNITLIPQAHAGRQINLYDGRITYARKTS